MQKTYSSFFEGRRSLRTDTPLKVVFFANTDWYLYNFRLAFAKFLRERDFEVVMLSPTGPYGALLQAEGFRWIGINMDRRSLNPGKELGLVRRISAVYRSEKPDIVHHFTIKCVIYGSLIARLHGIGRQVNAVTGRGHVFTDAGYKARLLRPLVRTLMKAALGGEGSRLILQNKDDVETFVGAELATPEQIHLVMGSGVDTLRFQPHMTERELPIMRVLLASRLLWDKGLNEYMAAARVLRQQGFPIEFLLAGSPDPGNPGSVTAADAASWERSGVISYLGHVSDMPSLFADIDLMVLPSYYGEGVPRCLLEAAASGLPIVTTDEPGCREIVVDRDNGLLIPARDATALTNAIRYMYEHPDERRRMGKAGRARVLNQFDQCIVFEKTLSVYQELLSARV